MLAAVEGYYDGETVVLAEKDKRRLRSGQRLIITVELASDENKSTERWQAFKRLEQVKLNVPQDFDYQSVLADAREQKYGYSG